VWFHRKNKAPVIYPAAKTLPRSHRRTPPGQGAPPIDPIAARWLTADADQLDRAAADNEAQAELLLARAIEWRTVAASYRQLALTVPAPPDPPAEPQPEPEDPSRLNPTWQLPQQPGVCGCVWGRGESCDVCDALVPGPVLWEPPPVADAAAWAAPYSSNDGLTVTFPAASGAER
jgi:hypothetical protein